MNRDEFEQQWLAGLPESWQEKRADFLCDSCRVTVDPEIYGDGLVAHYSIPQVQATGGPAIEPASDIDSSKLLITDRTLLVSKLNPRKTTVCIAAPDAELPTLASGEFVAINSSKIDQGYAYYLWSSAKVTDRLSAIVHSVTRSHQRVNPADITRLPWKWPPPETQRRIARFLDAKTARIDALIAKKRALLERLAEKRQALITQAVTKGLDPTVPMKDSGIDWFGNVPEGWIRVPLKRVIVLQRGHDLPESQREDGIYPVVSSAGYSGTHDVAVAKAPGIVTGRYGSIGRFTYVDEDYWPLNTALYSIELYDNDARFVWYLLQHLSALFVLNSMKSAVPGVDRNDVHRIVVCVPSLAEQGMITTLLDHQTARIDELAEKVDRSVVLLVEYRSALITAAVTGQLEIPADAPAESPKAHLGKLATEVV